MLGWIVLALVVLLIWRIWSGMAGQEPDFAVNESEAVTIMDYTPDTLQKYNGVDDKRVFLAVKGKVYDVTAGSAHYGPNGPYAAFAGRDASRGLAKHSFDVEMLTPLDEPIDRLSDLTDAERDALDTWEGFFAGKYPYCGRLVNRS